MLARHGIPDVISDNGPCHASAEFKDFAESWEFRHIMSSPGHAQSNGQAERTVQTIKNLLEKNQCNGDPYFSPLEYRNTPLEGVGSSPAQLLMGRRLRGKLPTSTSLLPPEGTVQVRRQLREKQEKQKLYFDRQTRRPSDLQAGENVRVQRGEPWQPAVALHKHQQPRSFVVRTPDGRLYTRNRKYLQKTDEKTFRSASEQDINLDMDPGMTDCCLFEDELCTQYEFCTNDGVFGKCQGLTGTKLYRYDVTPSTLDRLRTLLQKLAHRGLTWQDDVTQEVISRELSKVTKVPLHQLASLPGPRSAERKPAGLSRSLQQYLKDLGFLPRSEVAGSPGVQLEGLGMQNEDVMSNSLLAPSQPKPYQGWRKTTVYSLHDGAGKTPVTKVFTQSGEGKIPHLASAYPSPDASRSGLLSSRLEHLLAGATVTQPGSPGGGAPWPGGKFNYLGFIRPAAEHPEPRTQTAVGFKSPKPSLERLLFKSGSNHLTAKEPLSVMDEQFIQNVVNQLGRHSINMEALMGKDLDQLAEVITGALQVVDKEEPSPGALPSPDTTDPRGDGEGKTKPLPYVGLGQDQDLNLHREQSLNQEDTQRGPLQGQQIDGASKEPADKHMAFLTKLLDYLNREPFDDALAVDSPVNGGGPASSSAGQRTVGLENVQSRTTQGQVRVLPPWTERHVALAIKGDPSAGLTGGMMTPGAQVDSEVESWIRGKAGATAGTNQSEEPLKGMTIKTQLVHVGVKEFSSRGKDRHFGYIITNSNSLTTDQGLDLMERLAQKLNLHATDLTQLSVLGPALTFRVGPNPKNVTTADMVRVAVEQKKQLGKETGLKIVEAGVSDRGSLTQIPVVKETRVESGQFLLLSVLCMLFVLVVLAGSTTFFCLRQRSHLRMKEKLASLGTDTSSDATATYQELCRQRMATRTSERVERPETLRHSRLNSVSSQFSDGPVASPSARSSTSSWCEEPVPSNMDISTGHMILSYMEDHLKNKNRLESEWEALCAYQAEPGACDVGQGEQNTKRNRSDAVVVYDHSRITLKAENNHSNSDYINASPIMDHDPRNPTYISSQGPLPSTVADFWQMVWESGCVVIVMLTPLSENGVKQCHHYWPDEGSDVYHIYEVNLVSEHIWCEDFLVRSFYLKNLQTNETRTVTQFHFLSWMDCGIPDSARTLLDFRRKVNKCYRGRSCPIIVHCSDGAGRSGTYILIDMVLNRMAKGAKEIDIAATLEHLRDQRAGMVQTKEQFEFALTAVAEEVNAILKALPQ
ncbi:receptor-type tyrosine-protein phosphatase N2 [Lampris incognitus]|uniref:receptor-type tyrosine-protein phosphatase N2 n=1 Tax=Lampris incognitus TaxID=2546036 RepID=UPI0024B60BC5|nr:receptor-type tyrosine-protein phosphatase N2 [Lampris incognitus]